MACFAVVLLLLLIFILQNSRTVEFSYCGAHGQLLLGDALLLAASPACCCSQSPAAPASCSRGPSPADTATMTSTARDRPPDSPAAGPSRATMPEVRTAARRPITGPGARPRVRSARPSHLHGRLAFGYGR